MVVACLATFNQEKALVRPFRGFEILADLRFQL